MSASSITSTSFADAPLSASNRVGITASRWGTGAFSISTAAPAAGSTSASASASAVKRATGSLSLRPTVTHAKGRSSTAAHSESRVVFP